VCEVDSPMSPSVYLAVIVGLFDPWIGSRGCVLSTLYKGSGAGINIPGAK